MTAVAEDEEVEAPCLNFRFWAATDGATGKAE